MASRTLLQRIELTNILSFGGTTPVVELDRLNVLIGPNASGKSNLLEALALLRGSTVGLNGAIREGGGIAEYLWKGGSAPEPATIQGLVYWPNATDPAWIGYRLEMQQSGTRFELRNEVITVASCEQPSTESIVYWYRDPVGQSFLHSRHSINGSSGEGDSSWVSRPNDIKPDQSILSQRRDPDLYPELTYLGDFFRGIELFQEFNFGRHSPARLPQATDLPTEFLLPDARNLGLMLHELGQTSAQRDELVEYLRRFYGRARSISTRIHGGTLQLYVEEDGGRLIPATRLSEGTLRYLSLLAILLHPNPPPVIGIEEPELGLHPDILPTIAELLRKASERTQLFVTTHSDTLVSALSDTPECILVCESTPDGTTMKRLEAEPLREWLEKYSLGEIWRMGEIGGNRW
jgi:predicted ATPase